MKIILRRVVFCVTMCAKREGEKMVFENIKNFFLGRKKQEQTFYLMEFLEEKDKVCHIVEEKLLETMLMEGSSLDSFNASGYMYSLGWHVGQDGKMYERHALNEMGIDFYGRVERILKKDGEKYLAALNEINDEIESGQLTKEKKEIKKNFEKHFVARVTKYEEKEHERKSSAQKQEKEFV